VTIHFDIERAKNELRRLFHEHPELEEDCVLAADMVEGSTSFPELVDKLLKVIQEARAMEEAVRLQVAQLKVRQDRFANRQQRIRELMLYLMQLANQKRIERPGGTVTVANGPPKVIITDESLLGDMCVRIKRDPDKGFIAKMLKQGTTVPGATLSNAEPMLVIRT
jgi:erythromycin esterase-like protein